jgi:hypothetical protein
MQWSKSNTIKINFFREAASPKKANPESPDKIMKKSK